MLKQPYKLTNYRLIVEGIAETLNHVATALQNVKVQNGHMHIWDFVESGDVRQLLKILDNHPQETIALGANVNIIFLMKGNSLSYEHLRDVVCNFHFNVSYWSTPNRSRFLNEICSFDPYQLLKTVTSEDYYVSKINLRE